MTQYRVAVLGATGAVGQEFLSLLEKRHFPVSTLRLLASPRSQGRTLKFKTGMVPVQAVSESAFSDVQIAFFSAGAEAAQQWAPVALKSGAIVIDNSSAFRMDPAHPLVIPEVNWHHVRAHHRLFPVGNCTGILLCMALAPLRKFGAFRRVVVATYQSASGAGMRGMVELQNQVRAFAEGKPFSCEVFPHPIAFNVFSHNSPINEYGYNQEEWKVIHETRKVLDMPELPIEVTCVRVPVLRAHSLAVNVEFQANAPAESAVREAYASAPGIRLVDDREKNLFPMPVLAAEKDEVLVGRIRRDYSNPSALSLFVCGDQLRKGAALNAIQIAERLVAEGRIPGTLRTPDGVS